MADDAHAALLQKVHGKGDLVKALRKENVGVIGNCMQLFGKDQRIGLAIAGAVVEYLLTIANSNFEDWRKQNKTAHYNEFPFKLNKMSASGALFDMMKLNSVSADVISRMDNLQVYEQVLAWAQRFDAGLYGLLAANPDFALEPFDLPGIGRIDGGMLTLWPHIHGTDGFFIAKLRKVN